MARTSRQLLRAAALLALCLAGPGPALSQTALTDPERAGVVRAVLEAERERQARAFESVTRLSPENISSLNPAALAADFRLTLLTPEEVREKAGDFIGARYLAFKEFKVEGPRPVVRLAVAEEVTPCFGPYRKHQRDLTYRLEKTGGGWKAALVGHPRAHPAFGVRPDDGIHPTAN